MWVRANIFLKFVQSDKAAQQLIWINLPHPNKRHPKTQGWHQSNTLLVFNALYGYKTVQNNKSWLKIKSLINSYSPTPLRRGGVLKKNVQLKNTRGYWEVLSPANSTKFDQTSKFFKRLLGQAENFSALPHWFIFLNHYFGFKKKKWFTLMHSRMHI